MDKRKISILLGCMIVFMVFNITTEAIGAQYQRKLVIKQNQELAIAKHKADELAKIELAKKKKAEAKKQLAIKKAVEAKKQLAIKEAAEKKKKQLALTKEANRLVALEKSKSHKATNTLSRGGSLPDREGNWVDVRISYYTNSVSDCGNTRAIGASGKYLNDGGNYVAAPKGISFGTELYIDGHGTYTVQDRGGAIKYRNGEMMIDIFVPNTSHSRLQEMGIVHTRAKIY